MARVVLLIFIALCVFLLPARELLITASVLRSHADLVMIGNSVIRHASRCDPRSDSIAELLAQRRGQPTLDLSQGGQTPEQELNLAALTLRNPHVKHIVVPFSLADLGDWNVLPLQELLFWRAVNPSLPGVSPLSRLGPTLLDGPLAASRRSFVFRGVHYPGYDRIKDRFEVEKRTMTCPENDGLDQPFNRAFYAFQYTLLPLRTEILDTMAGFAAQARERGVDVTWPFLPINYPLVRALDPAVAMTIKARVQQLTAALATRGIHTLDLTETIGKEQFADRWCACGHLQLAGRQHVADAVAAWIDAASGTR